MVLDRGFSESQYLNEIEQLEKKLAAAEKRIRELAEQMISDAEYTAKLLSSRMGASRMASGQMAIEALEELKKGS